MLEQNTKTEAVEGRRLGFIGLGYMGSRIAKRLIDAGHRLVVYNRDRRKAEALVTHGAEIAASLAELASAAEAGTLTLFGGGDHEIFDAVVPLFRAIAKQWFDMGALALVSR